jgi:N-acetylglucosamine-6-sulfatase
LLSVDEAVGNILSALSTTGRLQNTLILYASDNGLANGEHRWIAKTVPYEESLRIPVIDRYDALSGPAPRTDSHLVLNMGLAPTFANAAGVSVPAATQGASFLPFIENADTPWRSSFLIEHGGNTQTVPAYRGMRTDRFTYVRFSDGFEELCDLSSDPFELQNVASDPSIGLVRVSMSRPTALRGGSGLAQSGSGPGSRA